MILFLAGYVFGAIPFGLVLCSVGGYGDIRRIGSGNIGATNVLRTGNKLLAALTLILDIGKGAIPIAVFWWLNNFQIDRMDFLTIGLGAIIGHNFPVWLKFKGGKGVATTIGTLVAAVPVTGLAVCLVWLLMAGLSRISSLSALSALFIAPFVTFAIYGAGPAMLTGAIALLGILRHHANISRLIKGQEPKINFSKTRNNKGDNKNV